MRQVKGSLRAQIPKVFTEDAPDVAVIDVEMSDDIDLSKLSWTVKSEVGQWIRQSVAMHYRDSK
jgi:mediator of RNA polymerase II transcription subunit 12